MWIEISVCFWRKKSFLISENNKKRLKVSGVNKTSFSLSWQPCKSNGNKSDRPMNLPRWTCGPFRPSIPHLHFSFPPPPANSWTLPKTPSQLIRHCLLPSEPVHKRPPRSQQGPRSKAASLVAPRNASRFGNRPSRAARGWRGGGGVVVYGKLENRNSPIMLMCWGRPVKNWRATKGNAFHSQGAEALHPILQSWRNPALRNTQSHTHTHI